MSISPSQKTAIMKELKALRADLEKANAQQDAAIKNLEVRVANLKAAINALMDNAKQMDIAKPKKASKPKKTAKA